VVVLVAISSALFGFHDAWVTWGRKISLHAEQPNSNHVGIRNVVSYSPSLEGPKVADPSRIEPWSTWQDLQRETFAKRKALFYLGVLLYTGLAVVGCRRLRLDQVSIVGLMMIPVFFYPANYYCHHVFLLPLLATAAGDPKRLTEPEGRTWFAYVSSVVMAMGFVQYFTLDSSAGESDVTATYESIIMLIAYLLILYPMARRGWLGLPPADQETDEGDEPPAGWTGVFAAVWNWWSEIGVEREEEDEDDEEEDEEEEEDEDEDAAGTPVHSPG